MDKPEPRAHICLYIPELDCEAHFDLVFEKEVDDILMEVCTALTAMIEPLREQLAGAENMSGSIAIN